MRWTIALAFVRALGCSGEPQTETGPPEITITEQEASEWVESETIWLTEDTFVRNPTAADCDNFLTDAAAGEASIVVRIRYTERVEKNGGMVDAERSSDVRCDLEEFDQGWSIVDCAVV